MNSRNLRVCATLFIFLFAMQASAQERTIAVDASATVSTKPDQLKFSVTLIKYGDSIKKAKTAFDEQKKSFNTSFNVMKFKGLSKKTTTKTISSQPSFPNGAMAPVIGFGGGGFGGGAAPAAPAESQFYVSETFEFTVDGIDKMSDDEVENEIMGYVTELKKLSLSATTGFSTSLSDKSEARKKAFAAAMKKARADASALADLSEGTIGKVIKVEQTSNQMDFGNNPYGYAFAMPNVNYGTGGVAPTISISANLRVTFELKD